MKTVRVAQHFRAPRQVVWDMLTDHQRLPEWTPLKRVTLDKEGTDHRDGVGAVRRMSGAGPTILEEVLAFDPPSSYEYTLRAGAPIRDHRGTVTFSDAGGGTDVTWTVRFRPVVPGIGWLVELALKQALSGLLKNASRAI